MEFLSEEERWASFVSSKHRRLVEHLQSTGVLTSPRCMAAVGCTDRGKFVLQGGAAAYGDHPHPIGFGATISAPHMHAYCLELLHDQLVEGSRVCSRLALALAELAKWQEQLASTQRVPFAGARRGEWELVHHRMYGCHGGAVWVRVRRRAHSW